MMLLVLIMKIVITIIRNNKKKGLKFIRILIELQMATSFFVKIIIIIINNC